MPHDKSIPDWAQEHVDMQPTAPLQPLTIGGTPLRTNPAGLGAELINAACWAHQQQQRAADATLEVRP